MKTVTVLMHFGDGSYHRIEVEIENDEGDAEAIEKARDWVNDNHFYEVERND